MSVLVRHVGDNRAGQVAFYPTSAQTFHSLQQKLSVMRLQTFFLEKRPRPRVAPKKHSQFPAKMNRRGADDDVFYKTSALMRRV